MDNKLCITQDKINEIVKNGIEKNEEKNKEKKVKDDNKNEKVNETENQNNKGFMGGDVNYII